MSSAASNSNSALLLLERLFLRILSHKITEYANIHIVVAEIAIFVSLSDVMYYLGHVEFGGQTL